MDANYKNSIALIVLASLAQGCSTYSEDDIIYAMSAPSPEDAREREVNKSLMPYFSACQAKAGITPGDVNNTTIDMANKALGCLNSEYQKAVKFKSGGTKDQIIFTMTAPDAEAASIRGLNPILAPYFAACQRYAGIEPGVADRVTYDDANNALICAKRMYPTKTRPPT